MWKFLQLQSVLCISPGSNISGELSDFWPTTRFTWMKENAAVRVIDTVVGVGWCEREVPRGAVICQNISYLCQWFPAVLRELKVFPLPIEK